VKARRPALWLLLVLLMVAVPIFEVWLLIQVGQAIGAWWTVLILVGEAVLGALLVRHQGSRSWRALNGAMTTGRVPTVELADAALVLVGAVLLMLPGFATDVIGLVFLLPFTRPLARRLLGFVVARKVQGMAAPMLVQPGGTVIRGETVEGGTADATPPSSSGDGAHVIIRGEIDDRRP
jgi:UPF0716 protein FxsA